MWSRRAGGQSSNTQKSCRNSQRKLSFNQNSRSYMVLKLPREPRACFPRAVVYILAMFVPNVYGLHPRIFYALGSRPRISVFFFFGRHFDDFIDDHGYPRSSQYIYHLITHAEKRKCCQYIYAYTHTHTHTHTHIYIYIYVYMHHSY